MTVTHIALNVPNLKAAEDFYLRLFGMQALFREAELDTGWATLPPGSEWEDAEAAGITVGLSVLQNDSLVLALEAAAEQPVLSHIGLRRGSTELQELRKHASSLGCRIVAERDDLLVLDDLYGIRWEITASEQLLSSGERHGRWVNLRREGAR